MHALPSQPTDVSAPARIGTRAASLVGWLALSTAAALAGLELLASWLTAEGAGLSLHVALTFVAWELASSAVVAAHALRRRPRAPASSLEGRPRVSVLVAAWNEERDVVRTVRSVLAQEGVELEVIIADDGSTDGTSEVLGRELSLHEQGARLESPDRRVRVLRLRHLGKGAALEAARRFASHPLLVTVDADTVLGPEALRRIAAPFTDPRVEAAAGAVVVRAPSSVLTRFQFAEYLKNTFLRTGWSELGVLEQVPGAFAAIRASALEAAGGFPTDSLTEDYEVAYRLYARAADEGRSIEIPTIAEARAYTDPPRTLAALVRQRTRWFAGFLSTLVRFRRLVLEPRAGAFGLVRLPIKVLDALMPPLGLFSLGALALGIATGIATGQLALSALSLALLLVRALADALLFAAVIRSHQHAEGRLPALEPRPAATWAHALLECWTYAWLKHLVVLRAYPFAWSRVTTWERSR